MIQLILISLNSSLNLNLIQSIIPFSKGRLFFVLARFWKKKIFVFQIVVVSNWFRMLLKSPEQGLSFKTLFPKIPHHSFHWSRIFHIIKFCSKKNERIIYLQKSFNSIQSKNKQMVFYSSINTNKRPINLNLYFQKKKTPSSFAEQFFFSSGIFPIHFQSIWTIPIQLFQFNFSLYFNSKIFECKRFPHSLFGSHAKKIQYVKKKKKSNPKGSFFGIFWKSKFIIVKIQLKENPINEWDSFSTIENQYRKKPKIPRYSRKRNYHIQWFLLIIIHLILMLISCSNIEKNKRTKKNFEKKKIPSEISCCLFSFF